MTVSKARPACEGNAWNSDVEAPATLTMARTINVEITDRSRNASLVAYSRRRTAGPNVGRGDGADGRRNSNFVAGRALDRRTGMSAIAPIAMRQALQGPWGQQVECTPECHSHQLHVCDATLSHILSTRGQGDPGTTQVRFADAVVCPTMPNDQARLVRRWSISELRRAVQGPFVPLEEPATSQRRRDCHGDPGLVLPFVVDLHDHRRPMAA